jgi:hypothetical protein
MPNRVSCDLLVTGPNSQVEKFLKDITTEDGSLSILGRLLPTPTELDISTGYTRINGKEVTNWITKDGKNFEVDAEENILKYGAANWYDWNIINYGCKWPENRLDLLEHLPTSLSFYFETPWSVPKEGLVTISKMYPELKFCLTGVDESMEWGVTLDIENGDATSEYFEPECEDESEDDDEC